MAKILRLHNSGIDTFNDWQNTAVYGSDVIEQIEDPNGANAKHEITSIPSPFARIDLVKSAFKYVVKNGLDGQTIFHKMVSDSLDIGEIFFKSNTYADRLKIIYWDKVSDLETLLSGSAKHKILGQTLKMFLEQDASAYNFDKMKRFFIIGYTGEKRKTEFDVLGATSPATLFFSIANNLNYVSKELPFNTDFPFDDDYNPLYKRDPEYIKYLFALKKSRRDFAEIFPEVNDYLDLTYEKLSVENKNEISKLTSDSVNDYTQVFTFDGNNGVEIISGMNYHSKKENADNISSDFEIMSSIYQGERRPLVLPVEKGTKYNDFKLTHGKWDGNNPAPYKDTAEISKRRLPQTNESLPYLTISDFLEERIIKMPYKLNGKAFFDANYESQNVSYFLPLKDKFFEFFSTKELVTNKMIELRKNSGGVKVLLHIPVAGGKNIDYERIYFENVDPKIDAHTHNDGSVVEKGNFFGFAILPNIRFENPEQANYRFVLSTQDDRTNYDVSFYNSEIKTITNILKSKRNTSSENYVSNSVFCIEKNNIEYIRITEPKASGILLPLMKDQQSNSTFTFAVDFGTSNTHIVCKSDNIITKGFDIEPNDKQLQINSDDLSENIRESIYQEICPELVGEKQISKFPMRSALLIAKSINWQKPHFALGEANYAFLYEKKARYDYNKVETNLKWSNSPDNEKIINCYIESLFFVMRNKVLINGGRLDNTKIFWTYPLSMTLARKNTFKRVWQEAYQKYFSNNTTNLFDVNESVAPYYYYRTKLTAVNNIVTIDIGGGTSDVVIANHGQIQHITSFRFAADSIFGDLSENHEGTQNGIIRQFKEKICAQLDANNLKGIKKILENLERENNSANIASLFFSLKVNKDLTDKNINIDFFRELQLDTTQKITFLIFYCAEIYHVAKLMKAKDLEMPRHIGFSGNGSRVIKILTEDKTLLESLTKKIFAKIYGKEYPSDGLTVVLMDNPKEATSMGAVMTDPKTDYTAVNSKKVILLGTDSTTFANAELSYQDLSTDLSNIVNKVKSETEEFVKFVFALNEGETSFRDSFGIDQETINIAQDVCKRDIKTYTENKLLQKLSEVNKEDKVEETMFFYPLSGLLNALTDRICEYALNNPKK